MATPAPQQSPAVPSTRITLAPHELIRELFNQRLAQELDDKFEPCELRLSEAGGCPRLRAAKAAGTATETTDAWDAGYFLRGRVAEHLVREMFRTAFPHRCRHEVAVRHPWGTGHIDLWFPAERFLVEIKSATADERGVVSGLPRTHHILQAQAYLHFFRNASGRRKAEQAVLAYVLAGRRMELIPFPVFYRPEVGERIEAEMAEIARHTAAGTLPEVPEGMNAFAPPCVWTTPGRSHRCPLWEQCWGEAAAGPAANASDAHAEVVDEYAALWQDKHEAEARAEQIDAILHGKRDELEAVFSALTAKKIASTHYAITRSEVAGRTRPDIDAAIAAGAIPEGALAPFTTTGAPSIRYLVKEVKTKS